jgi:hypothetical protein
MECPLCHTSLHQVVCDDPKHFFYQCMHCDALVRSTTNYLSVEAEKQRYLLHNNNVLDVNYQEFVSPIIRQILADFSPTTSEGLDFGAGTGPVTTFLLEKQGYKMQLYDPFFHPDTSVLKQLYDFIICCEVIEHFHHPDLEFTTLQSLLKPHGKLYCMTHIYGNQQPFVDWYYKNDPTHVFIYTPKTLRYIQKHFGFKKMTIRHRLVVFEM